MFHWDRMYTWYERHLYSAFNVMDLSSYLCRPMSQVILFNLKWKHLPCQSPGKEKAMMQHRWSGKRSEKRIAQWAEKGRDKILPFLPLDSLSSQGFKIIHRLRNSNNCNNLKSKNTASIWAMDDWSIQTHWQQMSFSKSIWSRLIMIAFVTRDIDIY